MVWYQPVALCTSSLLCILVRIWAARWSIRAWRRRKKEQRTFSLTVRCFTLWDTPLRDTHSHSCSSSSRHPLFFFFRSPSAESVFAETAWLFPLAGSVRLQRGGCRDQPRLGSSRKRPRPNIPAARVWRPNPESQADLSVQSGPSRGAEPDLCVSLRTRQHGGNNSRPQVLWVQQTTTRSTCTHNVEIHTVQMHWETHRYEFRLLSADISSVKVLNHTTPLQSRYGGEAATRRLSLQENHHKQRVLLRVEGNVPEYNLNCQRWRIFYYLPPKYQEESTWTHKSQCSPH